MNFLHLFHIDRWLWSTSPWGTHDSRRSAYHQWTAPNQRLAHPVATSTQTSVHEMSPQHYSSFVRVIMV